MNNPESQEVIDALEVAVRNKFRNNEIVIAGIAVDVSFKDLEEEKNLPSRFARYNDSDFGNFLWGLDTRRLGFSVWTAQGGAHGNNAVNGYDQNKWNPNYEHQILYSNADQQAIRNGYYYNRRPQENGVYKHDILKK